MKITPIEKHELYEHGNFIRSFDSMDDVMNYLENRFKDERSYMWRDDAEERLVRKFNESVFSVITSKHLKFEK